MDFKSLIKSKTYKIAILSLAALFLIFLSFGAGMSVGFHKARFSYEWSENYQKNFAGPRNGILRGILRDFGGKDFINSHGIAGQIMKIDGSIIIIKGRDGVEKSVIINNDVTIRRLGETIKLYDLKVDDFVVLIGSSNNTGQIEAKFIRVLPFSATSSLPMSGMFTPNRK